MVIASRYLPISSKTHGRSAETLGSQIMDLTSVSILTRFLLTDKLLGYFSVNLDQFAASGINTRHVYTPSAIPTLMCGDHTRCLCRQTDTGMEGVTTALTGSPVCSAIFASRIRHGAAGYTVNQATIEYLELYPLLLNHYCSLFRRSNQYITYYCLLHY
eukprot:sb/3472938/